MPKLRMFIETPDFENYTRRVLRAAHKDAGEKTMEYFQKELGPKRFDGSMERELMWAPRDPEYVKRKAKAHSKWRGASAGSIAAHSFRGNAARNFQKMKIKITTTRMKLQGELGKGYVNPKDATKVNMKKEIRRVSNREVRLLGNVYKTHYLLNIKNAPKRKNRRRIS